MHTLVLRSVKEETSQNVCECIALRSQARILPSTLKTHDCLESRSRSQTRPNLNTNSQMNTNNERQTRKWLTTKRVGLRDAISDGRLTRNLNSEAQIFTRAENAGTPIDKKSDPPAFYCHMPCCVLELIITPKARHEQEGGRQGRQAIVVSQPQSLQQVLILLYPGTQADKTELYMTANLRSPVSNQKAIE